MPVTLDFSAQPVDLKILPAFTGCDDPAMLADFYREFREVAQQSEAEILAATSNGDLPAMQRAAHRVKSSARYIGALQFGDISEALEFSCQRGQAGEANEWLGEWRREWQRVNSFLAQLS